jgi:hypothetical protein
MAMLIFSLHAQEIKEEKKPFDIPDLKVKLNEDGSHFVKFNMTTQIWNRYNQSNPGTLTDNKLTPNTFDIGIRRLRLWAIAKPLDWLMVATQFGMNNFNSQSPRKAGDFFHDAYIELTPIQKKLSIGTGLCAWNGHARYSAPSIGSILTLDAPLYQQATNDVNDQFDRALSIYVKGQIGKVDYRAILSDPLSLSGTSYANPTLGPDAVYNAVGNKMITSAYVKYQFLDEESDLMPYGVGSYLSKKKVLALGAGFEAQPKATVQINGLNDTVYNTSIFATVDVFVDMPLNKGKTDNFTLYSAYTYSDLGNNYVRNVGAMNPSSSVNSSLGTLGGKGNAYPLIGTGHTIYTQVGYLLPSSWFGKRGITLQPFADVQASQFNKLNSWMHCYNAGVNLLLVGNKAKLSLNYQNRPIFSNTDFTQTARNSAVILQWQVAL